MNKRKGRKHPKEVIIEYFDTLINKVDIYVEELLEIYNDDETLEKSETNSKKIDGKKRVMPKLKTDFEDDDGEQEENDTDDEIDDSEDDSESSTDSDSDNDDDKSIEDNGSVENEEKNDEEEEKSDDEEDEDTKSGDLQLVSADEEMNIDSEEDIEENSFDYSESDYSGYKEDEQIDDEEYQEKIYGIEEIADPYRFDTTFDKRLSFNAGKKESIKTSDYLNKVRSFLIDEIRKVEKELIETYESNKTGFKFKKDSSIEEMKKALFKNRFCFLLDTQADQKTDVSSRRYLKSDRKRVFNLCLIVTDFYLSNAQLNLIRAYFDREIERSYKSNAVKKSNYILNEENFFLQCVTQNIRYGLRIYDYETEVYSISKKSLLESLELMDFSYLQIPLVLLAKSLATIDFSNLRSLTIERTIFMDPNDYYDNEYKNCEVKDLSALSNLEYLHIKGMIIKDGAFQGLNKLIKLVLDCCKAKTLDSNSFASLKRLKILIFTNVSFNLKLSSLKSLKVLSLLNVTNFKYIRSLPNTESLEILHLSSHPIHARFNLAMFVSIFDMFKRSDLSKLRQLRFQNGLQYAYEDWFNRLTNLNRLVLSYNKLESAHFLKLLNLSNLLELDLSKNNIEKLGKNYFKGLTGLKWLNLNENPVKKLKPGVFNGLENLETLLLQNMTKILAFEKDSFLGLSSLRVLDLSNSLEIRSINKSIDTEALDQTPNLKCLRIKNTKLDIKENMISRLKKVKQIVLCKNDLDFYNFKNNAGLHFKVIGEFE